MGKVKEYIKMFGNGIANFDKVAEGLWNDIKLEHGALSKGEQEEILKRRLICSTCPFMSKNVGKEYEELTGHPYNSTRSDNHCVLCSCVIKIKTSSLSSDCGIAHYNSQHGTTLEPKWKRYESNN